MMHFRVCWASQGKFYFLSVDASHIREVWVVLNHNIRDFDVHSRSATIPTKFTLPDDRDKFYAEIVAARMMR